MSGHRFPDGSEQRASQIEVRAVGRRLTGHAAVFNVPAVIGGFTEVVRPGAFAGSLAAKGDVLALIDHDPGKVLGRTSSGTLRLSEDTRGLAFELDLPDTQLARDIREMVERRDVGGMSFGFRVTDEAWPARNQRELRSVDLHEISIVQSFPAYSQTSVSARARHLGRSEARLRLIGIL